MKTELLLKEIEKWSQADRENRVAAVSLSDKKTKQYYIHYAGHMNDIGKCVHAIMEEDPETAFGIFSAVTVFAHKNFKAEVIEHVNRMAEQIAELREKGLSSQEIYEVLKKEQ